MNLSPPSPTRRCFAILSVVALAQLTYAATGFAQNGPIQFRRVERATIETRLKSFSKKDSEREQQIKRLFQDAGCTGENLTEQPVKHQKNPNVICTLPGENTTQIIVGAHFDHISNGEGVADDWSGAALLPSLFESLSKDRRKHTIVFVAFTAEEEGLIGSEFYAKQLSKEQVSAVRAMVNLDTLGLGPTKIWMSHSDPILGAELNGIAKQLGLSLAVVNGDYVGDDDSTSFRNRKIRTVMVHSITRQTLPILHSSSDNLRAIKMDDYFDSYRLLAAYLAYLDATIDEPAAASPAKLNN